VLLSVRHGQEYGQTAGVVELVVEFERTFAGAELGPGKSRQTKIDDGGIEAVEGIFKTEAMLGRQVAAAAKQRVEKLFVNPIVAIGVGIGQRGLGDASGKSEVVGLAAKARGTRRRAPERRIGSCPDCLFFADHGSASAAAQHVDQDQQRDRHAQQPKDRIADLAGPGTDDF